MEVYNESEIKAIIDSELVDWQFENGYIERHLEFKNFDEAFDFMTKAAAICKIQNHHPEWTNVYKSLSIKLETHDANGITKKDVELALAFDELFTNFG